MVGFDGFHHVKLPVVDVAASSRWYQEVLGLTVEIEFVEGDELMGVALADADGSLSLALRRDPDRAAALAGFDPVALRAPSPDAVVALGRDLEARGEAHGGVVAGHRGGSVLVGLRDPDGIEVRVYADPDPGGAGPAPASGPLAQSLVVDGATIAYDVLGASGPPVLLVHAGVFGAWFDPLAGELAGSRRVIRVRRAGYVPGAPPATSVDVADHARHLAAVVEAVGAGPAHVVGHSSGSVIALQLAFDRPDLVRSLVLGEPPLIDALVDPADADFVRTVVGPVIGGAIASAAGGDVPEAFAAFMDAICGPDHRAVIAEHLGDEGLARAEEESAYFFAEEAGAVAGWRFDEAMAARITVPVSVVVGGSSPPPVHRLVARTASLLPTADVTTIAGDDHLLPLRSAPALARVVAEVVDRP